MGLFYGLTGVEIILMLLGVILFLVLLFILVYQVIKKMSYKYLLPFFLIPVLMIGFSSIKKISYDNGVIDIEKTTEEVKKNPDNQEARKALSEKIGAIESRAASDPSALVTIAKANLVLGDTVKAHKTVNQAVKLQPGLIQAKELKFKLDKRMLHKMPISEKK